MPEIKVTDEMIVAFEEAYDYPGITGGDTRAGLDTVFAVVERDYTIRPRRKLAEGWACRRCGSLLAPCHTCGEPSQCGEGFCVEHTAGDDA